MRKIICVILLILIGSAAVLYLAMKHTDETQVDTVVEVIEKADEYTEKSNKESVEMLQNSDIKKLNNNTSLEMGTYISLSGYIIPYPKAFKVSMTDNNHVIFSDENISINVFSEPSVEFENMTANSLPTFFNDYFIESLLFRNNTMYKSMNKMNIITGKNDKEISDYKVVSSKQSGLNFVSETNPLDIKSVEALNYCIDLDKMPIAVVALYSKEYEKNAEQLIRFMSSNISKISDDIEKKVIETKTVDMLEIAMDIPSTFKEIKLDNGVNYRNGLKEYLNKAALYKNIINNNDNYSDMAIGVFEFNKDVLKAVEYPFEKMLSIANAIIIDPYTTENSTRAISVKYSNMNGETYDDFLGGKCTIGDKTVSCNTIDLTVAGDFFNLPNSRSYYVTNSIHTYIDEAENEIVFVVVKGDQNIQNYEIDQLKKLVEIGLSAY